MKNVKKNYILFCCIFFTYASNLLFSSMQDLQRAHEQTPLAITVPLYIQPDDTQERIEFDFEQRDYRPILFQRNPTFYDFAGPQVGIGCLTALKEINQSCSDFCQRSHNCFVTTHAMVLVGVCCIKIGCCCTV